jgi:hypothetical protein
MRNGFESQRLVVIMDWQVEEFEGRPLVCPQQLLGQVW